MEALKQALVEAQEKSIAVTLAGNDPIELAYINGHIEALILALKLLEEEQVIILANDSPYFPSFSLFPSGDEDGAQQEWAEAYCPVTGPYRSIMIRGHIIQQEFGPSFNARDTIL